MLGFDSTPSELCERSPDAVECIAHIPLPFPVMKPAVAKRNLSLREGGGTNILLYIDLRTSSVVNYGVVSNTDAFTDV